MFEFIKTKEAKQIGLDKGIDFTPIRATAGSSGYDLRACIQDTVALYPGQTFKFPTGIALHIGELPDKDLSLYNKICGLLLPRSSNPGMFLVNTVGLLDSDYQGELFLKYLNIADNIIYIKPGDRIGQLVLTHSFLPPLTEVEEFKEATDRGTKGFGSTGK